VTVGEPVLGGTRPAPQGVQGQIGLAEIGVGDLPEVLDLADQCVEP
jgi:hypothetical protein